jgi:hypothetical protein
MSEKIETYEYVLKQDGSLFWRTVRDEELNLQQNIFDQMAEGTARTMPDIFAMEDWGVVHAAVLPAFTYLTVPLNKLPMRAPFKLVGEKKADQILVPVFSSKTDPVFSMEWEPFPTLSLKLLARIQRKPKFWEASGTWLFAGSKDGNQWRLPLPNIHDDCGVCEGDDWDRSSDTLRGALRNVLDQFSKSTWNADLWKDPEKTQRMFRFKPKKDGFDELPLEDGGDWTALCAKVSVDITKHLL